MGQRGLCGAGGGSHLHRASGVCTHAVSTLQRGGGGSEWGTAPEPHGTGGQRDPCWGNSHARLSPPWCRGCRAGRALPSNPVREWVTRGDITAPASTCTPHQCAWGTAGGLRSQTLLELSWGGQTYLGSWRTERHLQRGDRSVSAPGTATGDTEQGPRTPCSPRTLTFVGAVCGGQGGHCKRWRGHLYPQSCGDVWSGEREMEERVPAPEGASTWPGAGCPCGFVADHSSSEPKQPLRHVAMGLRNTRLKAPRGPPCPRPPASPPRWTSPCSPVGSNMEQR